MAKSELKRYLVRRRTGDVYVWTEIIAKRADLEEVWAPSPREALGKDSLPDPRQISLEQLERMDKADLVVFAKVKLGHELDESQTKAQLLDEIKQAILGIPAPEAGVGAAENTTRPFRDPADIRGHGGDRANVTGEGKHPAHEGARADQPVRT